jgi:tripartite-type tricarboxylate transporter receptor subunit TctC
MTTPLPAGAERAVGAWRAASSALSGRALRTAAWLAAACLLAGAPRPTIAQDYPSRPVRWVVPSAPGDGSDTAARLVGERLSEAIGQPVVIENKPGAGGVLGSQLVAKSPADGYTMIVGNAGSHGINAAIFSKLNYDVVRDFVPVAMICTAPNVMVVGPEFPARTVAEFVAYARVNGSTLNYATGGIGSSSHMSMELLKSVAGFEMTQVPYKGATPAVASVLSGESSVMIGNLPPWAPHLKAGKGRALAVTTATRHPSLPEVPALAETFPGFETIAWFGVLAPAGTPGAIVSRVNQAVNAVLARDDVRARLSGLGCDPAPMSAADFARRVDADVARWKKLAAEKGIRAD